VADEAQFASQPPRSIGVHLKGSPAELALAEAVPDFTLKVASPIIWHDPTASWPRRIYGGTCFFLRFANGIIGVTANHMVEALQNVLSITVK
jgi:hypothetical protein